MYGHTSRGATLPFSYVPPLSMSSPLYERIYIFRSNIFPLRDPFWILKGLLPPGNKEDVMKIFPLYKMVGEYEDVPINLKLLSGARMLCMLFISLYLTILCAICTLLFYFCLETHSIFIDKMGHCLSDTLSFPNYLSVFLFLLKACCDPSWEPPQ